MTVTRAYDLRHACVSTWLAAGVDSTQVTTWAGHGVAVLHRVHAHVLTGRESVVLSKIDALLEQDPVNLGSKGEPYDSDPN